MTPAERAVCDLAAAIVDTSAECERAIASLAGVPGLSSDGRKVAIRVCRRVRSMGFVSNDDIAVLVGVVGAAIRRERETIEPAPPTDPEGA